MVRQALCVGLLVLVLAAGAAAQVPQPDYELALEVQAHGMPIAPITSSVVVPFLGSLTCPMGSVPPVTPVTVESEVATDAPWANVVVSPAAQSFTFEPEGCVAGATLEWNGTVAISLTQAAPAFERFTITLTAQAGNATAEASWEESVAPYVRTHAAFDKSEFRAERGATVRVPLTVQNMGNAPIVARVVVDTDLTSADLDVAPPAPLMVEAFTGRSWATVDVLVPDGTLSERYSVWVWVEPEVEADPSVKDERVSLNALIVTRVPVVDELPMTGLPVVLFVLLVAAALRRHKASESR